jgi:ParB family chromosome partitioning protein
MSTHDSSQKGAVRKLGRGLSALLGTPVQIQVPASAAASAAPAAAPVVQPAVGTPAAATPFVGVQVRQPMIKAPAPVPPMVVAAPSQSIEEPEAALEETREAAAPGAGLREIPVERIVPNRRQPRTEFDQAALASLAASIKSAGLMQPIMVRPLSDGFELIAGERRWRAAKLIGLTMIPAVVRPVDDQVAAELALVENIQREDLNPMERAHALRRLADEFSLTHQEIADKVGLDRASVTNLLRLSELDTGTSDLVRSGKLTQGHAKALLSLADLGIRAKYATQAIAEDWSVRELERQVQSALKGGRVVAKGAAEAPSKDLTARDANVADLERQLADHLGTRVTIQLGRKKGSGRLTLDFYSLDQFDGLMQKMGFGGR